MGIDRPEPNVVACRWCGLFHGKICPFVKALEFDEDGVNIIRVEFFPPASATSPVDADYPKKKQTGE